jgi:hypothetical protein
MQAQTQFSPEQLIVAGRRAEAQGQGAYALQFYRYIADHFPTSPEAYEARDAIYRLTQPGDPQQAPPQHAPAPMPAPAQHPAHASMADVRPSLEAGDGPSHGRPIRRRGVKAKATLHEDDPGGRDDDGPRYGVGRFVAMMLGTIGWLMLVSAVLMIPVIVAALTVKSMPKGIRDAVTGNLIAVGGTTFGLLLLGLFAIFAAQVARATFDTAEAVRQLRASAPPHQS